MKIEDKITLELKKAFLEEIIKTIDNGKENGFPICMDKKGKLTPSKKRCIGEECGIKVKNLSKYCSNRVQGGFHTHPYLPNIKKYYGYKFSEEKINNAIKIYKKDFEKSGVLLQSPSHHDIVNTIDLYCTGQTNGTVCTGTDLESDKVECWTIKGEDVKFKDCSQAIHEFRENINTEPREWVKPLFDREIINLTNDKYQEDKKIKKKKNKRDNIL